MSVRISVCNNPDDADVVAAYYQSRGFDVTQVTAEELKVWDHAQGEIDHPELRLARLSRSVVVLAKK